MFRGYNCVGQVRLLSATFQQLEGEQESPSVLQMFRGRPRYAANKDLTVRTASDNGIERGHHEKFAARSNLVQTVWCHHVSTLRCGKTVVADPEVMRVNHYVSAVHFRFKLPQNLLHNDSSIVWALPHMK